MAIGTIVAELRWPRTGGTPRRRHQSHSRPDGSELGTVTKQTDGMLIALVLAITNPICLFVGALIGFIVRGWM